jgi:hypothetical protein
MLKLILKWLSFGIIKLKSNIDFLNKLQFLFLYESLESLNPKAVFIKYLSLLLHELHTDEKNLLTDESDQKFDGNHAIWTVKTKSHTFVKKHVMQLSSNRK